MIGKHDPERCVEDSELWTHRAGSAFKANQELAFIEQAGGNQNNIFTNCLHKIS